MAATVLLDPFAWGRLGANTAADFLEGKAPASQFVEFQSELVTQASACAKMPPPLREKFGMKDCK
jgi:ABC-type sugar transport system substrate-binding protein